MVTSYSASLILLTHSFTFYIAHLIHFLSLNINGWEMMISLGFLAAVWYYYSYHLSTSLDYFSFSLSFMFTKLFFSVRVSNELGRGSAKAARFSILTIVMTSFVIGFILFLFFLILRGRLAYIFTESEDVAEEVDRLSPLLAFSILLNSVQPVLSGNLFDSQLDSI